ncbi:tetratricopeptide repeat protein [Achromobacter aloeverae]|nr:tetratricopeptide repeat protein [Achromobacter aloeverae]
MYPAYSRSIAGSFLLAACLLIGGNALAADATPDQVYQAAQAGNYRQAQEMMDQILRDHPNSAKAHFVEAELLGKQGKLQQAQEELSTALRLDPSQRFAKPGAVDELRSRIASGSASRAGGASGGIPWGMVLGIAGLAIIVSLVLQARRRAAYAAAGPGPYGQGGGVRTSSPYGGPPPAGPQGGYGYPGGPGSAPGSVAGGAGSGILGGLATGAAVGAGMVAGEALMNRVLHGGATASGNVADGGVARDAGAHDATQAGYDMGGRDFGLRDADSWDDDDPTRKLKNGDDGGGQTWNIDYPWNNGDASGDGGDSWDGGGGGSDDDWT